MSKIEQAVSCFREGFACSQAGILSQAQERRRTDRLCGGPCARRDRDRA